VIVRLVLVVCVEFDRLVGRQSTRDGSV
jgi:hypothetical protein